MPSDTLPYLLKRLPSVYNTTQGTPAANTTSIYPPVYVGTTYLLPDASDIVQTLDSAGYVLDQLISDVQTIKDISYIGEVPVAIANLTSSGPLFTGTFEANFLPGYIFNVTQTTPSLTFTIPLPQNSNNPLYINIVNTGAVSFTCYNVVIDPGTYQVYNFNPLSGVTAWTPLNVTGWNSSTSSLITTNPINAVNVPGAFTTDLDPLGDSYGVLRQPSESDNTYKLRAAGSLAGPKLTPASIVLQVNQIYDVGAQLYEWFPSSYSSLLTFLAANPGYTALNLNGAPATSAQLPLGPAIHGPHYYFYVVVNQSVLTKFKNGVFSDYSFFDPNIKDGQVGVGYYGGFFELSAGEGGGGDTQLAQRLLNLLSTLKASGTACILIITG
jgi:hypothetical protein